MLVVAVISVDAYPFLAFSALTCHHGDTGIQFARIHTSSLIKIEKTLNRPITKFYNGNDVNVIAAELRLTKTRPTSFNKKRNLF